MHVLICGGGVIGASIAYFLSCRGVKATVIEGTGLACAASGKSGGFLARDWCDGSPLAPLARRSFTLHAELAEQIAGDWGYRRLDTYGGFAGFPTPSQRVRPRLAVGRGDGGAGPRLAGDDRAGPSRAIHHGDDACRRGAGRGIAPRPGYRDRAARGPSNRCRGRWQARRKRCRSDRDGALVDPRGLVAAAAGGVRFKGHSLVFDTGAKIPARRRSSNTGSEAVRC